MDVEYAEKSQTILAELSEPGGIEFWIEQGRVPRVFCISCGPLKGDLRFLFYIPPEGASSEDRFEHIEGGWVCFEPPDTEGTDLFCLEVDIETGVSLLARAQAAIITSDASYEEKEILRKPLGTLGSRSSRVLKELFKLLLEGWASPKEQKRLLGELLDWGSAVGPSGGTLWGSLENQIRYQAAQRGESIPRVLEDLFSQKTADLFMLSLQV